MKVIIIDDEQSAIDVLVQKLKNYKNITVIATANSGIKGISIVRELQPDLLFLDVELPDISGLDFLNQISLITQSTCRVVIYTAHPSYMLPAFRGKAFDFLLKPFDDAELQKIIQHYLIDLPVESSPLKDAEKILLYVNALDFRVVSIADVGIFVFNHDLRVWEVIVASQQEPIRLKRSTSNESLLNMDRRFIQVSQRHIINIDYLMAVDNGICQFYPPFDHINTVKVGRTFRKKLTERFCAL